MVDFVYSDRSEPDWCGDGVAEDFGARVARVCVDELVGDYTVSVEGLTVCEVGGGEAGV